MWVDLPEDKLRLPHVGVHRRTGRGRIALDGPASCPAVKGGARVYACAYGNVRRGRDRKADDGPVVAECKCPTTPSQGEGDRAADREATTHDRSQACKPRDGGRRPLTCKPQVGRPPTPPPEERTQGQPPQTSKRMVLVPAGQRPGTVPDNPDQQEPVEDPLR